MIDQDSVGALVHGVAKHRVVAGALLPHIGEQRVRGSMVHVAPDPYRERAGVARDDAIHARFAHARKVEPIGGGARPKRSCGARGGRPEDRPVTRVDDAEARDLPRLERAHDGDLRRVEQIADLIDPDRDRGGRLRSRT